LIVRPDRSGSRFSNAEGFGDEEGQSEQEDADLFRHRQFGTDVLSTSTIAAAIMYVLGISGGLGHDSSACLLRDGRVVAAVEEERLQRRKRIIGSPPIRSVLGVLAQEGIRLSDVDSVVLAWRDVEGVTHPFDEIVFGHQVFANDVVPPIAHVDHHLAHSAASFFLSGFERASILVMDGRGEFDIATTLAMGSFPEIRELVALPIPYSAGMFYMSLTDYLGYEMLGDEGKVMGLSAFGTCNKRVEYDVDANGFPNIEVPEYRTSPLDTAHKAVRKAWYDRFRSSFGHQGFFADGVLREVQYDSTTGPDMRRASIARAGQECLERWAIALVKLLVERTGCRNLVLGGGVALNCSANGAIARSGLIDEMYVFGPAGDSGTSIGAALWYYHQIAGSGKPTRVERVDVGPQFSSEYVEVLLRKFNLGYERTDSIAERVAELLCEGKTIGWFEGRMEFGPRALGNRSILALPNDREVAGRVNRIKNRETWRPLAPSILACDADTQFTDCSLSRFMVVAQKCSAEFKRHFPAVVHVDDTCRPQVVSNSDSRFHELLSTLRSKCGSSVVLNTSFNDRREPIVCKPEEAIRTFFCSGLDALAIEDVLVVK